jgi:SAM-dependent methyltransferase
MTESSKAAARAVWGASPAGTTFGGGATPGTREFFDTARKKRQTEEQPWLADLVPFDSFRDQRVLELGCGAGFDAYTLAASGAVYSGIDLTPENVERTRSHLAIYGFSGDIRVADAEELPFDGSEFDVVFSNGVLHHTPDIEQAFREAARVLRPGGEIWVVLYHRDSIFYWLSLGVFDHVIRGGFRRQSFRDRVAMVEYTTSDALPLVNVYTRSQVAKLLRAAGFQQVATTVRKLRPEDLPGIPLLARLWRWIPQGWLDRVGRHVGWYVIARARMPESDAA